MNFTFRMYSNIKFNRPIDKTKDYISPGSYEMVMNGKTVTFDFEDYEGCISKEDPSVLEVMQKNPDYDTFPDLNDITEDDLKHLQEIIEFYVYTGEPGESDIEPVAVTELGFKIIPMQGEMYDINCTTCIPYKFPKD